jgi:hypothetical protein
MLLQEQVRENTSISFKIYKEVMKKALHLHPFSYLVMCVTSTGRIEKKEQMLE